MTFYFWLFIGNADKNDLDRDSYYSIMKFWFDSILCWLLLHSTETYYGDSLKDVVLTDNQTINDLNHLKTILLFKMSRA